MPSVTVDETQGLSRITSFRRQHPRSAGDSNRPMRNENILELVRFFQTPKDSRNTESSFEMFKAGQRKLRKLGQSKPDKQSKATATTMTLHGKEDKDKQVVANLQQSGYLPSRDHSTDLERRPSRARRDVEAMGRPWLDDAEEGKDYQYQKQNRHISLGLGDLTALVEFSVSFPEYDSDGVPPPYQERQEGSHCPPTPFTTSIMLHEFERMLTRTQRNHWLQDNPFPAPALPPKTGMEMNHRQRHTIKQTLRLTLLMHQ